MMEIDLHPNVEFFWSGPFSQWTRCAIDLDGISFVTAEQAMMHGKALLFADREIADRIRATDDPGRQKALGRQVRGFGETVWATEREGIVRRVNLAKFGQNKGLRRKLFQTLGKELVEASPMDTIWGIGLDEETARQTQRDCWPGQNLLGRILTEVRAELAAQYPDEAETVQKEVVS